MFAHCSFCCMIFCFSLIFGRFLLYKCSEARQVQRVKTQKLQHIYVGVKPNAKSKRSYSSSVGSSNLSYVVSSRITWQVLQANDASQAPKTRYNRYFSKKDVRHPSYL